jgi:hypothetical protein
MKNLKDRSSYLEERTDRAQRKANSIKIIIFILLILGAAVSIQGLIINNILIIVLGVIILQVSWILYKNSRRGVKSSKKGIIGEQGVIEALKKLSNSYYLINDILLQKPYGNIDHIVLGPNGIFVIETKNYSGTIICNGDEWHRRYKSKFGLKDYAIASPSKQVKRNAVGLKNFLANSIDATKNFQRIFVNGIIVFTDPRISLTLIDPTVAAIKLEELPEYIERFASGSHFSKDDLDLIAEVILSSYNQIVQ